MVAPTSRRFTSASDPIPRTHLLSNGRYVVMLTTAGSGYSHCGPLAITRWREDTTRDAWGTFVFLRDTRSGEVWSAGFQPSGREPDSYEVTFLEDRAEIQRRDGNLLTRLEVLVAPEDDAEIRRGTLPNLGREGRGIRTPMSMIEGRPLSNATGAVLDPIFSLRRRLRLAPGGSGRVVFSTVLSNTRADALGMADKYRDPATFERITTLAWTQAQVQ